MTEAFRVRTVDAGELGPMRPRLSEILIDCVGQGASVGFLAPLSPADADAFWRRIERAVAHRRCVALVGGPSGQEITGTVLLDIDTLPNQPHRATVSKLLVHSAARRRGLGETLMEAVERAALDLGRSLLTLDTATVEAERLYQRLRWTRAGAIPDYALNPDRTLTPTVFYFKRLEASVDRRELMRRA